MKYPIGTVFVGIHQYTTGREWILITPNKVECIKNQDASYIGKTSSYEEDRLDLEMWKAIFPKENLFDNLYLKLKKK